MRAQIEVGALEIGVMGVTGEPSSGRLPGLIGQGRPLNNNYRHEQCHNDLGTSSLTSPVDASHLELLWRDRGSLTTCTVTTASPVRSPQTSIQQKSPA